MTLPRASVWMVGLALSSLALAAPACVGEMGSVPDGAGGAGGGAGGAGGDPLGGGAYGGGTVEPSGYLLLSKDRYETLKTATADGMPEWSALIANVEDNLGERNIYDSSPENYALAYLFSGDPRYASEAYDWVLSILETEELSSGSYLYYGDLMRPTALVLNYCNDALDEQQRATLVDYLDRYTNELWFDNQGSGWGLDDPGNNYHMAFIEGTAYAGYALRAAGHPNGQKYVDLAKDKLERAGGVLEYLETRQVGGDWNEGANYGERSKERLFDALAVIVSMGDDNYFNSSAYFANSIYFAIYQLQPDRVSMYPSGDLARDVAMPTSPYTRDHIQSATYWLLDKEKARGFGQWYLDTVAPTYDEPGFRGLMFFDVLYELNLEPSPASALPLSYRAAGTEMVNVRSSWDEDATSVTISGSPIIDQSHAHVDTGSFTIFKKAWLAADAVTYGHDGLNWAADAHNMVHVPGHERISDDVPGLTRFWDGGDAAYVQVDASNLFRTENGDADVSMLDEYTRELVVLRPDALVVYDRVDAKPGSEDYEFRMHFGQQPTDSGDAVKLSFDGGGITLQTLLGGSRSITQDGDLVDGSSNAWRVSVAATGEVSRFLHVAEVASGAAPSAKAAAIESAAVDGVVWQGQVVAFSKAARGSTPSLPFTYSVPDGGSHTHTVVNMSGKVDVAIDKSGGTTTVTVKSGDTFTATDEGVLVFTD